MNGYESLYATATKALNSQIEINGQLQAENKRLKEEIIAAIEMLEIGVINSQTGTPLWESVESVQYNLEQALTNRKGE